MVPISSTYFGKFFAHPRERQTVCYILWYYAPTISSWVHYTTSCNTHSSAPEDGQINCPKPVGLTGIINKPFFFASSQLSILFISMMHGQANIKFTGRCEGKCTKAVLADLFIRMLCCLPFNNFFGQSPLFRSCVL